MKKITVISDVNPTRSYSCIVYLCDFLGKNGFDVELYAKIPKNQIAELQNKKFSVKSFYSFWYGGIPVFRRVMAHIHVLLLLLSSRKNFIFHELIFFRQLVFAKNFLKSKKLVHYATELYDELDEPSHRALLNFYKAHANSPDLIIDCDPFRVEYRKEHFGIHKEIVVIFNSLPSDSVVCRERSITSGKNREILNLAGFNGEVDKPILVYTGAAYLHRELDKLVDGVAKAKSDVFFLAFCYGPQRDIDALRSYCSLRFQSGSFCISMAKSRDAILSCLSDADIGMVYYKPSLSIGNRFAAPTKLFEYISTGLPVICSNNENLVDLISDNRLGVCVADESVDAVSNAIDELLSNKMNSSDSKMKIKQFYHDNLEYCILSKNALSKIVELFEV